MDDDRGQLLESPGARAYPLPDRHHDMSLPSNCNRCTGPAVLDGLFYMSDLLQGFFLLRMYRLSEQRLLLALGSLLAITKFGLHLAFGIAAYRVKDAHELVNDWGWCITSYLILSIACDALISTSLSYHLQLRKTGFDR